MFGPPRAHGEGDSCPAKPLASAGGACGGAELESDPTYVFTPPPARRTATPRPPPRNSQPPRCSRHRQLRRAGIAFDAKNYHCAARRGWLRSRRGRPRCSHVGRRRRRNAFAQFIGGRTDMAVERHPSAECGNTPPTRHVDPPNVMQTDDFTSAYGCTAGCESVFKHDWSTSVCTGSRERAVSNVMKSTCASHRPDRRL